MIHDCQPPRVTGGERAGDQIRIRFDERVDPTTVAGAVSLTGASAIAGTTTLSADGRTATFAPSTPPLPAGALRLAVTQAVRDLAGNPLAFPWSQVFGAGGGTSFLAGTVIDDATGRPLAGARVLVFASNGTPLAEPLPEQVTGEDGRFRLPVGAGTHDLTIVRPGYTPAFRIVAAGVGQGADVFDPRLTPSAATAEVGAAGGTLQVVQGVQGGDDGPVLAIPAGALATVTDVAVTRLSEQGLPAILPYGWSPRGAAWVEMGGASLAADATLALPVESPNGTTLVLVKLDLQSLQWRAAGTAQVSGGKVSFTLSGAAGTGYAAVEADDGAVAPPAAVAGQVLGASPRPVGDEATGATLTFDPEVVLPSQASLATAAYTLAGDAASGLPLTLVIEEELVLLDGSTRRQAPYQADLVLYKAPDGSPRSRFLLMPSAAARLLALELGSEDVTVRRYGGESVSGNVVGPEGGTVLDAEGDRIDLPQGAVTEASAIGLTRRAAADLPATVPAGTALAGVVELDLGGGGKALLVPAALSLAMATPPAQGDAGLLLQVVDLPSGRAFRPVAALQATATGWTTATIDPADLPWPGVRDEGLYAFVRLTASLGYLRGTVFDVGGAPLAGAVVAGQGLGWIQLSAADGSYVLPVPVGTTNVTADNLATGNRATASATAAADERVDLDLQLQAVGPRVLELVPADGATEVAQGIQPTIRFSEPVDRASLAAGIQLLRDGQPVAIELEHSGAFVRLLPKSTLLPQTAYEVRVGFGVRDLQGISLTSPTSATFTTKRVLLNEDLDLTKVFLVEPDGSGTSQVIGRPGAVPAGTTVFIENATSLAATPSVTAGQNGSFQTTITASLTDTIILHVLIEGANEVVVELTPFLSADLRSARVDQKAATFTTGDGVTVMVPAGAFAGPVRVSVTPQPLASPAPYPVGLQPGLRLPARLRRRRGGEADPARDPGARGRDPRPAAARPHLGRLRRELLDAPGPPAARRRPVHHRAAGERAGGARRAGGAGAARVARRPAGGGRRLRADALRGRRPHGRSQGVPAGLGEPRALRGVRGHHVPRLRRLPVRARAVVLLPADRHRRLHRGHQPRHQAAARARRGAHADAARPAGAHRGP